MAKRNTREILINEGIKALIENGYEGVGIQQILGAVGVPKGSFYNHFESKESFALEVLETYDCRYKQFVADHIFGEGRPLDRLRGYFAALEVEMSQAGPLAGCLYGVLSHTSAQHSAPLRTRLKLAFSNWRNNLNHLLKEAQACGDVSHQSDVAGVSDAIIDAYEGALVRMRAEGDIGPIQRFREITLECFIASITSERNV